MMKTTTKQKTTLTSLLPSDPNERRAFKKTEEYKRMLRIKNDQQQLEYNAKRRKTTGPTSPIELPIDPEERRAFKQSAEYHKLLSEYRATKRLTSVKQREAQKEKARKEALKEVISQHNGKVKSYRNEGRYYVFDDGRIWSYHSMCFKTQCKTVQGYHYIGLPNGERQLVHRMVAETFLRKPKNKNEVNHLDLDKSHNALSNLAWCNRRENILHAIDNGANVGGVVDRRNGNVKFWNAKVIPEQVIEMRDFYSKGFSTRELSKMYNLTQSHVLRIVKKHTWKHL